MTQIKVKETEPRIRAQNLQDGSQEFDFCDVCGTECNKKRFCCASINNDGISYGNLIHFDVCSEECVEMGILQRIE